MGDLRGQSQGPSPSEGKNSQPQQTQSERNPDKSAPDQRGTEQTPFIVKILPAQKNETDKKAKKKRRSIGG
jgi:hypothetical protein